MKAEWQALRPLLSTMILLALSVQAVKLHCDITSGSHLPNLWA